MTGVVFVFLFAIIAGVEAYQANLSSADANRRLGQNEDLVGFLLDDLIEDLRPIGRLDLLRSVGEKTITFFKTISDKDLTDVARLKHVQALHQIGEVYFDSGEFGEATEAFKQSLRQIKALYSLDPENTERIFELGQAHFWVGFSNWYQRNLESAEEHLKIYLQISKKLVYQDQSSIDKRVELAYAYGNLGSLESERRNYLSALSYFDLRTEIFEDLSSRLPERNDLKHELANTYSWLGSLYRNMGQMRRSLEHFKREENIYENLLAGDDNAEWNISMVHTYRHIGEFYIEVGKIELAIAVLNKAQTFVEQLIEVSPENIRWQSGKALSLYFLSLAHYYREDFTAAESILSEGKQALNSLLAIDSQNYRWQLIEKRYQLLTAMLFSRGGNIVLAMESALRALDDLNRLAEEETDDVDIQLIVARIYLLVSEFEVGEARTEAADKALGTLNLDMKVGSKPGVVILAALAHHLRGDSREAYQSHLDWLIEREINHPEIQRIIGPKL